MEGRRQSQQNLCKIIKKDIQQDNTAKKMGPTKNPLKAVRSVFARFEPFAKAGRTEHFIFMFGDTFPTEKSTALRTTGHGLAKHVV